MTQKFQIYKCQVCENIVEVLHEGIGELVCCNKPMMLFEEKMQEEGNEKHKPIIEEDGEGVVIKVSDVPHPMEEKHFIEWIEISTDKGESKKFLKPGDKPEISFPVKRGKGEIQARAYCNVHGLWTSS
jgi:superoxide reductase